MPCWLIAIGPKAMLPPEIVALPLIPLQPPVPVILLVLGDLPEPFAAGR